MAGASKKTLKSDKAPPVGPAPPGNISLLAPTNSATAAAEPERPPKKKRNRGARNKKSRRRSFVGPSDNVDETADERPNLTTATRASNQASFYRIQSANRSNTSLESEALLDHRDHGPLMSRRQSLQQSLARSGVLSRHGHRSSDASAARATPLKMRPAQPSNHALLSEDEDEVADANDRTPLLSTSRNRSRPELSRNHSGVGYGSQNRTRSATRRNSNHSRTSSRRLQVDLSASYPTRLDEESHDVNNPPSVPGSPTLGSLGDVFLPDAPRSHPDRGRDTLIPIDREPSTERRYSTSSHGDRHRRPTLAQLAERDVCFPADATLSDEAEDGSLHSRQTSENRNRRRRTRAWPDFEILEEWSREEKEERTHLEVLRAKKISEPVMVGGRLRPAKTVWHAEKDDAPFRFTYFNEALDGTIHARTISDLSSDGLSFRELFLPEPMELSDASDMEDNEDDNISHRPSILAQAGRVPGDKPFRPAVPPSESGDTQSISARPSFFDSNPTSGHDTPRPQPEQKRLGQRPTFWLDVLRPTEMEMKVLAKTFGIHQLTIEDILMEEEREKVELFQSYYFVNYRTFEQDKDSDDYMSPINMYVVVFRDGVISFHHSMTPHPANVRRRIRHLNDYLSPSADWISYAIIDDITDVYAPLVSQIEEEVDDIDEEILYMHTTAADKAVPASEKQKYEKSSKDANGRPKSSKGSGGGNNYTFNQADMGASKAEGDKTAGESGGDMLRRVGECRKKVMGLYRLLGNKADVIKGFAKRCNEHWEVAPRSEIGLYLGDIQDHIVTMTGNLAHYESLLSRAHGNYVAQINIRMNERAEQNSDVLGKLTVLGTIVLPMNIITGMWGMNVWVPGQEYEGDLTWFFCITAGLIAFGLVCYFIAKKVYGIV